MRSLVLAAAWLVALGSAAFAQTAPKSVTRTEATAQLDAAFNAADKNHDGTLTLVEMQALQASELQTVQNALRVRVEAQFKALDTNKDGTLSLAEFSATTPNVKINETPQQLLQKMDSNHDGKVSAAEFRAPRLAVFDRADTNHDGVITPAEAQAAAAGGKK